MDPSIISYSANGQTPDMVDGNCFTTCVSASSAHSDTESDVPEQQMSQLAVGDQADYSYSNEIVVKRSLECYRDDEVYKMTAPIRGICVIVNNIRFENEALNRLGAEKDCKPLTQVFQDLGFTVHYWEDLTSREMSNAFRDCSQREDDHQKADCFVSIILTHGWQENKLYGVDGSMVSLEELLSYYNNENCPQLIHKPKLFFVQACRGEKMDWGVCLKNVADAGRFTAAAEKQVETIKLPTWSDTFICFSTVDGYVSLRNVDTGSWFVHALITTICEHACDTELYQLMMKVNKKLMGREGSSNLKQSLETVYRGWTRSFYFNPGHSEF